LTPYAKFAFVGGCLLVAIFMRHRNLKDWLWLVAGLGFTLWADYFLVLRQEEFLGVAVFCFVHVCYIFRTVGFRVRIFSAFFAVWCIAFFILQSVIVFAGIYAVLFAVNIYVNAKARRPRTNQILVMAGLILFLLCDVNVLLMNLPQYVGTPVFFGRAYTFVWVFYLPSQILLGISARDFKPRRCAKFQS